MAPVEFGDIGKAAKDLLSKDFNFGKTKLETKTTTKGGVEFNTILERNDPDGSIRGELKTKFKHKDTGLTFTDTYTTTNDLSVKLETSQLLEGLTADLEGTFNPGSSARDVKVGAKFKSEHLIFTSLASSTLKAPKLKADAVVGFEGALLGGQATYDVNAASLADFSLALAYTDKKYAVALHGTNKLTQFSASISHNYSSDLTLAATAALKAKDNSYTIELGTQYKVDKDSVLKAKVDSTGKVGLGYSQKIRPDLKVSFGLLVDTRNIDQNAHKLGYSFLFEPK